MRQSYYAVADKLDRWAARFEYRDLETWRALMKLRSRVRLSLVTPAAAWHRARFIIRGAR